MNFRVQVFDRAGNFEYAMGKLGDSAGAMFRPKAVSVDSEGDLYIADGLWGVVQVFNRAGSIALLLRRPGHPRGRVPAARRDLHRPRRSCIRRGFVQPPRAGLSIFGPEEPGQGGSPVRLRILLAGVTYSYRRNRPGAGYGRRHGDAQSGPGSTSHITGARPDSCAYCHAPHSGVNGALEPEAHHPVVHDVHHSKTVKNTGVQPAIAPAATCASVAMTAPWPWEPQWPMGR